MGPPMKNRIRKTLALVLGIMALACLCMFAAKTWIMTAISGFALLISAALSVIFSHMLELNPADSHTWRTVVTQYLIVTLVARNGQRIHRCFIGKCKKVSETQAEVLNNILKTNQSTVYGIKYGFSKMTSAADFISSHPLTKYNHYLSYIHAIAQGKQNILTKDKVVYLATSSGTTGAAKLIPVTQMMKGPTARYVGSLMYYMMKQKGRLDLGRVFVLSYKSIVTQVSSGLKKGPITAHMFRYLPFAISPEEAFEIPNEQEAIHVHAVFALRERNICHIEALMSTLVYSFWRYIERNWESICDDIERASLPKNIHADRDILDCLKAKLYPDAHRADSLRQEFVKGFRGIARRVWPRVRFVRMLATGGFAHYAEVLAHYYMTDVKQLSLLHVASEGFIGVNICEKFDNFTYTAMIEYAFQEYIPLEYVEEEQPVTVMAEQVELNKLYEVVITTPTGLYRYRTGDIVKITGFCYQCPVYEFQYRSGQLLNLNWEKLPESVMYDSVLGTVQQLSNVILVDYTATEDIHLEGLRHIGDSRNPDLKHYVLFIEIERQGTDFILSDEDKLRFDETLRHNFQLYNTMRENLSIGPMEVIQVKKGSFHRLKEQIIEHTQSQQYKLPRVMRHRLQLKYLLSQDILSQV